MNLTEWRLFQSQLKELGAKLDEIPVRGLQYKEAREPFALDIKVQPFKFRVDLLEPVTAKEEPKRKR